MKHVLVLGAGISSLATAWFLHKKFPQEIVFTILEKENQIGGLIKTDFYNDIPMDLGPKGFKGGEKGFLTLQLIEDLNLTSDLRKASPQAIRHKFIYCDKKIHKLSLFSCLTKGLFSSLWKDLKAKKMFYEDDTVQNFLSRHCSSSFITKILDPSITAIRAGNIHKMSLQQAFPTWKTYEALQGSLIKAFIRTGLKKIKNFNNDFFSLQKGMQQLPLTLASKLPAKIILNTTVKKITSKGDSVSVLTDKGEFKGDISVVCLPSYLLPELLSSKYDYLLKTIEYQSLSSTICYWDRPLLKKHGYGMVIEKQPHDPTLGIVWLSSLFPLIQKTCLSSIFDGCFSEKELSFLSQKAMTKYMAISKEPCYFSCLKYKNNAPLQLPFHYKTIDRLNYDSPTNLYFGGQGIFGSGINKCIEAAKKLSEKISF